MDYCKITIGDEYSVISSGTVITHQNKDVVINIIDDANIVFKFEDDDTNKQKESLSVEDNKNMVITLTNYNNALGTGISSPLIVGTKNDEKISIQFIIHSIGDNGCKIINYTFLKSKINGN